MDFYCHRAWRSRNGGIAISGLDGNLNAALCVCWCFRVYDPLPVFSLSSFLPHFYFARRHKKKVWHTQKKILSATPTEKSCFSATDTKNTWWCSRKRNVSIMTASFLKNLFFKSRPPNGFSVILSKKEKASDAV